jgi:hypothetical protein
MSLEKEENMKTSLLSNKTLFLFLFIGIILFAFSMHLPGQVSGNEVYNFIRVARTATWVNKPLPLGAVPTVTKLNFNDRNNDKKGFVRYVNNAVLEDGQKYPRSVLQTHPEWKNGGLVIGYFYDVNIPANAKFSAKVGFLQGAKASDGATFEVSVYNIATKRGQRLIQYHAKYDGKMDEITADLKPYAGQKLRIELRVNAGSSSSQDWAVWQQAGVVTAPMLATAKVSAPIKTTSKARVQTQKTAVLKPGTLKLMKMKPMVVRPIGTPPPKHDVTDLGPVAVEEPIALSEHIYRDNKNRDVFYFLPREINLIKGRDPGSYRINAVWTQDKKIKATFFLSADIDPSDVRILEEAVKKKYGSRSVLRPLPYNEANIIDMEGWGDWQIEDIRFPSFGSLEGEMPINITMTPESMAELKPLMEKEGLTAGMHIKSAAVEKEIPIKVGLRYFVGSFISPLEEVNFSFNNKDSTFTIHNVKNFSDFPLKVENINLRFNFANRKEVYKALRCDPEVIIPPGEEGTITVQLTPQPLLKAELRNILGEAVKKPKKKSLLDQALGVLKEEVEEKVKKEAKERVGIDVPESETYIDPEVNQFFKDHLKSYWLEISPDFDNQESLDNIWGKIEAVSYIERMRKINIEVLENVFDPSQYETSLQIEKVHVEIKSPYLSPQPKEGLIDSVDLTKENSLATVLVYLPLSDQEPLEFSYKIKAITKTGESAESVDWEFVSDSLDLTIGVFHISNLFK